jgi:hypothetical protein
VNLAALLLAVGVAVMPQPWGQLVRRDHALVAGMPGCGKTPFAASLAADARRVVYFDPTGEWEPLGEVIDADELVELVAEHGAPAVAGQLLPGTFRRLVVTPEKDELHDAFAATVEVCRAAAPFGGLVLLADEVGDLTRDAGSTALLLGLHRNGHKHGVASVLASPCMTDFPKRCRDTASRVYSFFQKNAADRAAMAAEYGADFATAAAAWRYPNPPAVWTNPTLHS